MYYNIMSSYHTEDYKLAMVLYYLSHDYDLRKNVKYLIVNFKGVNKAKSVINIPRAKRIILP